MPAKTNRRIRTVLRRMWEHDPLENLQREHRRVKRGVAHPYERWADNDWLHLTCDGASTISLERHQRNTAHKHDYQLLRDPGITYLVDNQPGGTVTLNGSRRRVGHREFVIGGTLATGVGDGAVIRLRGLTGTYAVLERDSIRLAGDSRTMWFQMFTPTPANHPAVPLELYALYLAVDTTYHSCL